MHPLARKGGREATVLYLGSPGLGEGEEGEENELFLYQQRQQPGPIKR